MKKTISYISHSASTDNVHFVFVHWVDENEKKNCDEVHGEHWPIVLEKLQNMFKENGFILPRHPHFVELIKFLKLGKFYEPPVQR